LSLETLVSDYCEMEERHRLILRRHKSILEKDLEPKDVLSKFTTVLDQNDEDEINHLASCLIEAEESSSRCEGLKNERDSARRKNETLENKIQEWRSISEVYLRQNQELQENLKSVKEEHGILQLSSRELEAAKEEQQQKIRQLQRKNTDLGDKVTKQTSEYLKTLAREKKKNKHTGYRENIGV